MLYKNKCICPVVVVVVHVVVVVSVAVAVRHRRESFDTFIYHWKAPELLPSKEFVKYTHTHSHTQKLRPRVCLEIAG